MECIRNHLPYRRVKIMKLRILLILVIFSISGVASAETAKETLLQQSEATLPLDVEYRGAYIDATHKVLFYETGYLRQATLKDDFVSGEFTFEAGTEISFFEDGSIQTGYVKNDTEISNLVFIKGSKITFQSNGKVKAGNVRSGGRPDEKNLVLPIDMYVQFDNSGHVVSLRTLSVRDFKILDLSCASELSVVYDEIKQEYLKFKGTISKPQLVAVLTKSVNNFGQPIEVEPLIAPALSTFTLYIDNPIYAGGTQTYDYWKVNGSFTANGYNLGSNPQLIVRDMKLHGVQIFQDMILDGHKFKARDVITFNNAGKVNEPNVNM